MLLLFLPCHTTAIKPNNKNNKPPLQQHVPHLHLAEIFISMNSKIEATLTIVVACSNKFTSPGAIVIAATVGLNNDNNNQKMKETIKEKTNKHNKNGKKL